VKELSQRIETLALEIHGTIVPKAPGAGGV